MDNEASFINLEYANKLIIQALFDFTLWLTHITQPHTHAWGCDIMIMSGYAPSYLTGLHSLFKNTLSPSNRQAMR